MPTAITLYTSVLALHIAAVIVAFGVTFAYPVIHAVGIRSEPRSMPGIHRIQDHVGRKVILPGMIVALAAGIYLAADHKVLSAFYVQWGFGAIVVLGGLSGAFFAPTERRLAQIAARDVSAAGSGEEVTWSEEYTALRSRVAAVTLFTAALILATVFFMTVKP